jgi:hypothetical protein
LSNWRELADAEPIHRALAELFLLALRSRIQWIRLEQRDTGCIATLRAEASPSSYSWPLPPGLDLLGVLKQGTRIKPSKDSKLLECQERLIHVRLKPHRLEVSLVFQADQDAERVDLRWYDDDEVAKRAERISNKFHFILRTRASIEKDVFGRDFN